MIQAVIRDQTIPGPNCAACLCYEPALVAQKLNDRTDTPCRTARS
jgi:hypothetical protein